MTETLRLTIPIPPTVNACYTNMAHSRGKRRVLTAEARTYKDQVKESVLWQALAQKWRYTEGQRLSLTLHFHFTSLRRDISNAIKIAEDSIAEGLGFDDRAVDRLVVERGEVDKGNPRVEVVVERR